MFLLSKKSHAAFLVAGTCIGGGMLALPLWIAQNGFLGVCLSLFICWLFMTSTAYVLIEVTHWFPAETSFLDATGSLLGKIGRGVTWAVYLFIAYASLVSYLSGGGEILKDLCYLHGGWTLSSGQATWIVIGILTFMLLFGSDILAQWNSMLFSCMILFLGSIALLGFGQLQLKTLSGIILRGLPDTFPLFLTSFSFQMIIPSLRRYLDNDQDALRSSVLSGMALTLSIYLGWLFFVFCLVPETGPYSLAQGLAAGHPITTLLSHVIQHKALWTLVMLFSLFALTTSFLGISMGLIDFLGESLPRIRDYRSLLLTLVLLPGLFFALINPNLFLLALDLSGGLGDTILNGLIPLAMFGIGYHRFQGKAFSAPMTFGWLMIVCFASTVWVRELVRLLSWIRVW